MTSKIHYADFPIEECAKQAAERVDEIKRGGGECDIFQKWSCKHCGSRQTMEKKNQFFKAGVCEACKGTTVIAQCNYVMHIKLRKGQRI